MPVLSVDLAHKRWGDIGVCSLEAGDGEIVVEPISLPGLGLSGAPTAAAGLPGFTKPAGYLGFIAFAIDVFDRLSQRGWPRLPTRDALGTEGCFALECFPTSAWRRLGLAPLPGKANRKGASVAEKLAELQRRAPFELRDAAMLSHDELQAAVAGLAGLGAEGHPGFGFDLAGVPPFRLEDTWREGFIVNPKPW